jgi:hypothetical protein
MHDFSAPDDTYDALKQAVKALGSCKKVGPRLRPEIAAEKAADWLRNCLNEDHAQKLDPDQVFTILRWACDIGFHGAKHYLDKLTGYAPSTPLAIESQLLAALADVQDTQRRLAEKEADLRLLADNPRLLETMRHAHLKVDE